LRAAGAAPAPDPAGGGDGGIARIIAKLKGEAEAFAKQKDDLGPPPSPLVRKLLYDDKMIAAIQPGLVVRQPKMLEDGYVAYQLLQPLRMARNEQIHKVKPALLSVLRTCQYQSMPQWPAATLKALEPPTLMPTRQLELAMDKIHELREQKFVRERPVAKHNRVVKALEDTAGKLLILMDDREADTAILKQLDLAESQGRATWQGTLADIKSEVVNMKKPRAKVFYDAIRDLALKRFYGDSYIDPSQPTYNPTGNSSFQGASAYFPITCLEVVNVLATAAREPAMNVPNAKEVPARKRPARGR
jgi:hypothetical protein